MSSLSRPIAVTHSTPRKSDMGSCDIRSCSYRVLPSIAGFAVDKKIFPSASALRSFFLVHLFKSDHIFTVFAKSNVKCIVLRFRCQFQRPNFERFCTDWCSSPMRSLIGLLVLSSKSAVTPSTSRMRSSSLCIIRSERDRDVIDKMNTTTKKSG